MRTAFEQRDRIFERGRSWGADAPVHEFGIGRIMYAGGEILERLE